MSQLKKYKHAPAHLFVDDSFYFFTGAVYQKRRLLKTSKAKGLFVKYLFQFIEKYQWELFEWSVLDNHYHFMAKVQLSKEIPHFFNTLHKTSAFHIKRALDIKISPFWYQYWDRCIRNEKHYFETASYILYNPIKHGYTDCLEEYEYSSYSDCEEQEIIRKKVEMCRPEKIVYYKDVDDF